MARPNMIVVGTVVLGSLILGVEGYAFYRYHRHRPSVAEETQLPAPRPWPEGSEPPRPTPIVALPTAPPIAPAVEEASMAEPDPQGAAEPTQGDGGEPEAALRRRQRALAQHRGEILQMADEQVFDLLNLDDSKRAAIRAIDEAYLRASRALDELPPTVDSQPAAVDFNAIQTRRAAIGDVLGADGMGAFNSAERRAQRRARSQLRPQSVRGL